VKGMFLNIPYFMSRSPSSFNCPIVCSADEESNEKCEWRVVKTLGGSELDKIGGVFLE
jgi:hypothetical protein